MCDAVLHVLPAVEYVYYPARFSLYTRCEASMVCCPAYASCCCRVLAAFPPKMWGKGTGATWQMLIEVGALAAVGGIII